MYSYHGYSGTSAGTMFHHRWRKHRFTGSGSARPIFCNVLPAGYPSSAPRRLFRQQRAARAATSTFSHLEPAWVRRLLCFLQKRRSPPPDLLSSETPSTFSFLYELCPLSHRPGPSSRSRSWRPPASTRRPVQRFPALWPSGTACPAPGLPGCPWWREQEGIFRLMESAVKSP